MTCVSPATHEEADHDRAAICTPASGGAFRLGHTKVTGSATDAAGNHAAPSFFDVFVRDATPPILTVPANITVGATGATGAPVSFTATAADLVDVSDPVVRSPASGSTFPVGTTTVRCTASDRAGNTGSAAFGVTVTPAATGTPDGRMFGIGLINEGNKHQHFAFRVSQVRTRDTGRLEYWVTDPRRCAEDDYDHDRNHNGDHDDDYGRDHRSPQSRFEATSIGAVTFSDDPAFRPGGGRRPIVDTISVRGAGTWNGRSGYTFEMIATDQGERGRDRDTFSLVVRDSRGIIVAKVTGDLDGGNVQSTRLGR